MNTVETFGRLDVAHNNAGVPGPYQPLWEYREEDFAAVLWLASPEASYVTGTVLTVDGGYLAR